LLVKNLKFSTHINKSPELVSFYLQACHSVKWPGFEKNFVFFIPRAGYPNTSHDQVAWSETKGRLPDHKPRAGCPNNDHLWKILDIFHNMSRSLEHRTFYLWACHSLKWLNLQEDHSIYNQNSKLFLEFFTL
jgi:hypothetical protein